MMSQAMIGKQMFPAAKVRRGFVAGERQHRSAEGLDRGLQHL